MTVFPDIVHIFRPDPKLPGHLLSLDEFSYVRRDQAETSAPFELTAKRHERKSLAVAANSDSRHGTTFCIPLGEQRPIGAAPALPGVRLMSP